MLKKILFAVMALMLFTTVDASQKNAPAVIFASSNNKFVLPVFIEKFYNKYPNARVVVQYGASGDLSDAILNGVSYDVFLSANEDFAQKVYDAKKAAYPPKEYARGSLILFITGDTTLSQKKLKVVKNKNIKHITIANKETAPYGMATIEVLKKEKLFDELEDKVRYSTDVSTVITNVIWYDDAGFLSKSAVQALPMAYKKEGVNWIELDPSLYSPIIQSYVVSKDGAKNVNTIKFLEYMHSEEGRKIYQEFGYK